MPLKRSAHSATLHHVLPSSAECYRKRLRLDYQTKPFECPYTGCERSYAKPSKLEDHIRSHTGLRPFCCSEPNCSKKFIRKSHLQAHARSHLPKDQRPYICHVQDCSQRFSTHQHLTQHQDIHNRPRPYGCHLCTNTFHKNHQLKKHIAEIHLHTKPNPCPIPGCSMSFTFPSVLEKHVSRVHDQTKRYGCGLDDCLEHFSKWSLLQAHIKAAHKMKCAHCGKTYSDKTAFRLHVDTHETPLESRRLFQCKAAGCTKKFTRAHSLKKHVNFIHNEIRDYQCQICDKEFAHRRTLKAHAAREHSANKIQKTSGPRAPLTHEISLFGRLTGDEYATSGRDLCCPALGCLYRFARQYDLDRHLATYFHST